MKGKRRIPAIVATTYLVLVLLAIIPIFTGNGPLSGIFAVGLTMPWSTLLGNLVPGELVFGLLIFGVGAAINAAIIYFALRWLVNRLA